MVALTAIVVDVRATDTRVENRAREEVAVGARLTPRVGLEIGVGEGAAFLGAV